jgi:hypothetical protein
MIGSIVIICLILLALFRVPFYRFPELNKFVFPILFLIKVLVSIVVWWYYYQKPTYGIESDMYQFFHVANKIQDQLSWLEQLKLTFGLPLPDSTQQALLSFDYWHKLHDYGLINDNRFMIRINLLLNWIVGKDFASHAICFTFIGFSGSVYLFKMIRNLTSQHVYIYLFVFFLLPSGLIWTGSMYKEATVLFTLGGCSYFLSKIYLKSKIALDYMWLLVFTFLLLQTKPLFSILFLYTFLTLFMVSKLKVRYFTRVYLLTFFIPILVFSGASALWNNKSSDQDIRQGKKVELPLLLKNKQADFFFDVRIFKPETEVELPRIDGSYISVLNTIPYALKNVFVAPVILSIHKWEMIPFGLEMLAFLLLLILTVIYPKRNNSEIKTLLFSLFLTSILCLLFLGLSVPIAGLIVKYASPVMPFVFLFAVIHIDWDKLTFVQTGKERSIQK